MDHLQKANPNNLAVSRAYAYMMLAQSELKDAGAQPLQPAN
jgi:hypothetical protein